jgi:hypothetical protein
LTDHFHYWFWLIGYRGPILYALTLLPLIAGLTQLSRRRHLGRFLILLSLLAPVYFALQWFDATTKPARRSAEIASWPRTTLNPADRPRVLVVRSIGDRPPPFAHFLAETGLFEVYVVNGLNFPDAKQTTWQLAVTANDSCRTTRTARDEMVVLTGWRACAVAVRIDRAPIAALVLYADHFTAPHSWSHTRQTFTVPTSWTLELAIRDDSKESLVAYDEYVGFPQMRFNIRLGPYLSPREAPRRPVSPGASTAALPDPAEFLLAALAVDERAITPPYALTVEETRDLVDSLSATGRPDDTQRALDLIAAAPEIPACAPRCGGSQPHPKHRGRCGSKPSRAGAKRWRARCATATR